MTEAQASGWQSRVTWSLLGDIKIESTVGVGTRVLVELRLLPHERQLDNNRLPRSAEAQ